MKKKLFYYRFCGKRWFLLFVISFTSLGVSAKDNFGDHLEFAFGVGPSKFTGTVNMSGGDFLSFYRTDGNKIGSAFTHEIRYHFSDYVAVDLHSSIANLSGDVTYNGDPTGTNVTITPGTKRAYKTTIFNFIPMVNLNLLKIVNHGARDDLSFHLRMGVGMSYSGIQILPFQPSENLYDFAESSHWFVTGAGGFIFQKKLNNGWSCFGSFTMLASATSKVDAYYMDSKPVNEGIPSSGGNIVSRPFAADTHAYMAFGLTYRIKASSSVGGHRYKSKKMSRSSLRKRRKKHTSPWVN